MTFSRVATLLLSFALASFAQEFRGAISGSVTDPSGAAVANAKIVATETSTGVKVQTVSEATGQYNLPYLSPGSYDISATVPGFKEFVRRAVPVGAGDRPVIDVTLAVGDTS